MIMKCWNWCTDAINDVPVEVTSDNGIMYSMRVGQVPKLNKNKHTYCKNYVHNKRSI